MTVTGPRRAVLTVRGQHRMPDAVWRLERDGAHVATLRTSDGNKTVQGEFDPAADVVDATVGMTLGVGAPGAISNIYLQFT